MTMPQLHGPMGLCVLQWCHPMLAYIKRTSYCTQMITLYGARKVDSGPRNRPLFKHQSDLRFGQLSHIKIFDNLGSNGGHWPIKGHVNMYRDGW